MAWHLLLLSWVALLGVAMGASPSPPSGTPSAVESAKSILQPQEILAGSSAMTGGEAAGRAVLAVHPSKVDPAREVHDHTPPLHQSLNRHHLTHAWTLLKKHDNFL